MRIGVPRALVSEDGRCASRRSGSRSNGAVDTLREQGAEIVDVALPHSAHAIPVYYLVATAEASSNLARYDGVRYGYRAPGCGDARRDVRPHARRRVRPRGQAPHPARHLRAERRLLRRVLPEGAAGAHAHPPRLRRRVRRRVDVVAMPTSPTPAFALGERMDDPLQMYLADVFTVAANLAGLPSISIPCGFTEARLPCSLQLTGRAMDEATVLRVADAFERVDTVRAREAAPPEAGSPRTLALYATAGRLARTSSQTTKPIKRSGSRGTASAANAATIEPKRSRRPRSGRRRAERGPCHDQLEHEQQREEHEPEEESGAAAARARARPSPDGQGENARKCDGREDSQQRQEPNHRTLLDTPGRRVYREITRRSGEKFRGEAGV